jgi:hypothetical protein
LTRRRGREKEKGNYEKTDTRWKRIPEKEGKEMKIRKVYSIVREKNYPSSYFTGNVSYHH